MNLQIERYSIWRPVALKLKAQNHFILPLRNMMPNKIASPRPKACYKLQFILITSSVQDKLQKHGLLGWVISRQVAGRICTNSRG